MMLRPIGRSTLLALVLFGAPGCGDTNTGGLVVSGPPVASVVVTPVTRTIFEGGTAQLTANAFDADGAEIRSAQVRRHVPGALRGCRRSVSGCGSW